MSRENNLDVFIRTGTLYKCFIPVRKNDTFEPRTDYDIYAVSELEALEYLINEADFSPVFMPNAIYEIPAILQKHIEKATRQRLLVQGCNQQVVRQTVSNLMKTYRENVQDFRSIAKYRMTFVRKTVRHLIG